MIKKLFKLFCFAIMAIVVGMMAFRIYTLNCYPASAEGVVATASLKASYKSDTLKGITWEPYTEFDSTGDFFIHQPVYFENEKTLIVTVRYNNSLLKEWKHSGKGDTLILDVTLYADGKERIYPVSYTYSEAYGIYSYRRYAFENVTLSDYEILYLDIYNGESDYSTAPYSSISVYDQKSVPKPYSLSGADKRMLKD